MNYTVLFHGGAPNQQIVNNSESREYQADNALFKPLWWVWSSMGDRTKHLAARTQHSCAPWDTIFQKRSGCAQIIFKSQMRSGRRRLVDRESSCEVPSQMPVDDGRGNGREWLPVRTKTFEFDSTMPVPMDAKNLYCVLVGLLSIGGYLEFTPIES